MRKRAVLLLTCIFSCCNVSIQSNYIGQGLYYEDYTLDISQVVLPVKAAIEMVNVKDVLIGGATAAEGNVIKAERAIGLNSRYAVDNGFIRIENNLIGKHYDRVTRIETADANRRWDGTMNGNRLLLDFAGHRPVGKPISARGPVLIMR